MSGIQIIDHRVNDENPSDEQLLASIRATALDMKITMEQRVSMLRSELPDLHAMGLDSLSYIDDDENIFEYVVPSLIISTRGRSLFLLDRGCSLETTCEAIRNGKSNIVLIDGYLRGGKTGPDIVKIMRDEIACVGFSSSQVMNVEMEQCGAVGSIKKCIGAKLIPQLVNIMARLKPA